MATITWRVNTNDPEEEPVEFEAARAKDAEDGSGRTMFYDENDELVAQFTHVTSMYQVTAAEGG